MFFHSAIEIYHQPLAKGKEAARKYYFVIDCCNLNRNSACVNLCKNEVNHSYVYHTPHATLLDATTPAKVSTCAFVGCKELRTFLIFIFGNIMYTFSSFL